MLSSPAARAWATAEIIAQEIGYPRKKIAAEERIYEAGAIQLLEIIRELDERRDHVMLFGHNPALTHLVNSLAGCQIENVPTCGIVHISFNAGPWQKVGITQGSLVDFDYPKRLDD